MRRPDGPGSKSRTMLDGATANLSSGGHTALRHGQRSKWTPEEDRKLLKGVSIYGTKNWILVAGMVPPRTAKQCRERYTGQLDPRLNHESWSFREDCTLIGLHQSFGNCWAKIASFIPGRSANCVKNRYKFIMKKNPQLSLAYLRSGDSIFLRKKRSAAKKKTIPQIETNRFMDNETTQNSSENDSIQFLDTNFDLLNFDDLGMMTDDFYLLDV